MFFRTNYIFIFFYTTQQDLFVQDLRNIIKEIKYLHPTRVLTSPKQEKIFKMNSESVYYIYIIYIKQSSERKEQ